MKIQLFNNYGGDRTREQRIVPGIYDVTDPALFGLADYLVENGHAVYRSDDELAAADAQRASAGVPTEAPEDTSLDQQPQPNRETPERPYEDWSLVELRDEVAMRGISSEDVPREEGRPATKANLATALRNHDLTISG